MSFGRILGERIIMWMFSEKKFYDYKDKIDRLGGIVLFFGNILPGPIELLAVFYGGFKYDFTRYLYLTLIGRLIKFVLIFLAFFFFWDQLVLYYEGLLDNFLIIKDLYL
jgi:membrane protein YqaA with SNARE-associated domain